MPLHFTPSPALPWVWDYHLAFWCLAPQIQPRVTHSGLLGPWPPAEHSKGRMCLWDQCQDGATVVLGVPQAVTLQMPICRGVGEGGGKGKTKSPLTQNVFDGFIAMPGAGRPEPPMWSQTHWGSSGSALCWCKSGIIAQRESLLWIYTSAKGEGGADLQAVLGQLLVPNTAGNPEWVQFTAGVILDFPQAQDSWIWPSRVPLMH